MRNIFVVLASMLLLISGCATTEIVENKIDVNATAAAPWSIGEQVGSDNVSNFLDDEVPSYRIFLGVTTEGRYLVQEFYLKEDRKRSDAYVITLEEDVEGLAERGIEGAYIVYYENGKKRVAGQYENGLTQGHWQLWYEDGTQMEDGYYEQGKRHGRWQGWFNNGNPNFDVNFSHDVKVGQWQHWYESGSKLQVMHYDEEGERDGEWTRWYENGQKHFERSFSNGDATGIWKSWDQKGVLKSEQDYN